MEIEITYRSNSPIPFIDKLKLKLQDESEIFIDRIHSSINHLTYDFGDLKVYTMRWKELYIWGDGEELREDNLILDAFSKAVEYEVILEDDTPEEYTYKWDKVEFYDDSNSKLFKCITLVERNLEE